MQAAAIKQRLLGAMVLVLLGFIVWPFIFDDYQTPSMDMSSRVPPMPDFDEFVIEQYADEEDKGQGDSPSKDAKASTLASSGALLQQESLKPKEQKAQAKALKDEFKRPSKTPPKAWVVQVGSFSKQTNTQGLVDKLTRSGLKAYWRRTQGKKQLYTVYVGPYLRQADAQADKVKIDQQYKLSALVKTYKP